MKDNKVERVRQEVAIFRRQFLQDDTGAFDQALGNFTHCRPLMTLG